MKYLVIILSLVCFVGTSHAQENIQWTFKTEGRVYSSPFVDGNRVYIGSADGHVYAVDVQKGKRIWQFKTGGPVFSSPLVTNDLVFISSDDGSLYALDQSKGSVRWQFKSKGEKRYGLWDYYRSSPVENDGAIYWGSGDGNIYAIDALSGDLNWSFTTGDVVHASPVVVDNELYIGSFDGFFYCLDKQIGELKWKFDTIGDTYFPKGEVQRAALVHEGAVYFGSRDYNIYALDAKTGKGRWNFKQPQGWVIAQPTVYKENIYFGTSDAHLFYCMDKNNGTIKWELPLNMRVYGSAVMHQDILYFGTFDGKVLGVEPNTGEIQWQFQTEASKQNYSTVYDESGKFKEGFELYGADTMGSELKILSLGSILSTPAIDNGIIYFGSADGNLYAVALEKE